MAAPVLAHAQTVRYRSIGQHDIDDIVTAFDQTWGWSSEGQTGPNPISMQVSRHFVLHYLLPTTQGSVALLSGQFVGVALTAIPGEPVLFPEARQVLATVDGELASTPEGAAALRMLRYWHEIEPRLEEQVGISHASYAEVELFLVTAAARGRGVGGALWRRTLRGIATHGVQRYFLHTDSSCDVRFYDHHGLDRVLTRRSADHPEDLERCGERLDDLFIYSASTAAGSARGDAVSAEAQANGQRGSR